MRHPCINKKRYFAMTDIIFSFDTEDFTSSVAADAIIREAEILNEEGIRGCFCMVGLLAKQLENWGRTDVIEALKLHEISSHSYGHSLHPTINEYTDIYDFEEAKNLVIKQETEAIDMIKHATGIEKIYAACPPGNQKSYVAMYAYSDMGIPIYTDTYCDTDDGQGVYYCNIYNVLYTYCMEQSFFTCDEEHLKNLADEFAKNNRVVIYTHPNFSMFSEFWDRLNYDGSNINEFGNWKECKRRPVEESEKFYNNLKKMIRILKNDKRFRITTYGELAKELSLEPERKITLDTIPELYKQIKSKFFPVISPNSFSMSDMFLACRDLLCGKKEHLCSKVYGFLEEPYAINEQITLSADSIRESARKMSFETFLPTKIDVDGTIIGPADWLRAAMAVLCGETNVIVAPGESMPSLDVLPQVRDCSMKGWIQRRDFEDKYLSKRLKLQSWTMRFSKNKCR